MNHRLVASTRCCEECFRLKPPAVLPGGAVTETSSGLSCHRHREQTTLHHSDHIGAHGHAQAGVFKGAQLLR